MTTPVNTHELIQISDGWATGDQRFHVTHHGSKWKLRAGPAATSTDARLVSYAPDAFPRRQDVLAYLNGASGVTEPSENPKEIRHGD